MSPVKCLKRWFLEIYNFRLQKVFPFPMYSNPEILRTLLARKGAVYFNHETIRQSHHQSARSLNYLTSITYKNYLMYKLDLPASLYNLDSEDLYTFTNRFHDICCLTISCNNVSWPRACIDKEIYNKSKKKKSGTEENWKYKKGLLVFLQ